MATFTLSRPDLFPSGTSVGAYRTDLPLAAGPPAGAAVETVVAGSTGASFSELADNTRYLAAAQISGSWVGVLFMTAKPASGLPDGPLQTVDYGDETITEDKIAFSIGHVELGYAEITDNATATTAADVPGLSVTVVVGIRPIDVIFGCPRLGGDAVNTGAVAEIAEGATGLQQMQDTDPAANAGTGGEIRARLLPDAGEHTYKIRLARAGGAGNAVIYAADGAPAYIQVIEV